MALAAIGSIGAQEIIRQGQEAGLDTQNQVCTKIYQRVSNISLWSHRGKSSVHILPMALP
jgi:hypothetical protein